MKSGRETTKDYSETVRVLSEGLPPVGIDMTVGRNLTLLVLRIVLDSRVFWALAAYWR